MEQQEVEFDVHGLKICGKHYKSNQNGKILAIHGWLDNANSFDKILPEIQFSDFLSIDLAGHGKSDHRTLNTTYTLWDYAMDLKIILGRLNWKNYNIVAHSMGTGVASILATIDKNIGKIIFIDGLGAPFVTPELEIAQHFQLTFKQLEIAKRTGLYGFSSSDTPEFNTREDMIEKRMNGFSGNIPEEAAEILVKRDYKKVKNGYRWLHDPSLVLPAMFQMSEGQAQSFLKQIKVAVVIIFGEKGLFPRKNQYEQRLACLDNVQTHKLPGGHHLHLESSSGLISRIVNTFLNTNTK